MWKALTTFKKLSKLISAWFSVNAEQAEGKVSVIYVVLKLCKR
jgi:hypothetical protein